MKKFYLLILLLCNCNLQEESFSLSEINLDEVFKGVVCDNILEWKKKESFQYFINILQKEFKQKYQRIVIMEYSRDGETVEHNSLVILHDNNNEMTVLSFGMDWNHIRKKIKIPFVSTEKIYSELSFNGSLSKMSILDISKNTSKCYFKRNINYEDYKELQNLSFFSNFQE